jgi:glycosyltransferase involved in cell wall biosynthesis
MKGLSVTICTFNPDREIFQRVLTAIAGCAIPGEWPLEYLLVDNNCTVPLTSQSYVQDFLAATKNARVVVETEQGLTASRKRGIMEASYDHILFVDDDNELAPDYFSELHKLSGRLPFVGACNAGIIEVEFIGKVDAWYHEKGKVHFQQSEIDRTIWGNDSRAFRHWPFGTGLMVKKDVALHYVEQVTKGCFSLTDRKGGVLTSGGDGQLVACALSLGYGVGRSKELKLKHLIAARKTTLPYLTKIDYGIYFSNEIFMHECFPHQFRAFTRLQEMRILFKLFLFDIFMFLVRSDLKKFAMEVVKKVGTINGKRVAAGKPLPGVLKHLEKRIISR